MIVQNRHHRRQTQQTGNRQHGYATPKRSRQCREEGLPGNHFRQFKGRKAGWNNCRRNRGWQGSPFPVERERFALYRGDRLQTHTAGHGFRRDRSGGRRNSPQP